VKTNSRSISLLPIPVHLTLPLAELKWELQLPGEHRRWQETAYLIFHLETIVCPPFSFNYHFYQMQFLSDNISLWWVYLYTNTSWNMFSCHLWPLLPLWRQNWVISTVSRWSAKLKSFTIWSFPEKVQQYLVYSHSQFCFLVASRSYVEKRLKWQLESRYRNDLQNSLTCSRKKLLWVLEEYDIL
jgi:hypothetical protein